jgi:hypothetical protein
MSGVVGIGKSPGIHGGGTGVLTLLPRAKPGVKLNTTEIAISSVYAISVVVMDSVVSV